MAPKPGYSYTILYLLFPRSTGKRQKTHVAETGGHLKDGDPGHGNYRRTLCGIRYRVYSNYDRKYRTLRLYKTDYIALPTVTCLHCQHRLVERYPQRVSYKGYL